MILVAAHSHVACSILHIRRSNDGNYLTAR